MIDDADRPHPLRRRAVLSGIAGAGTLLVAGRALAQRSDGSSPAGLACTLTPAQTEGPYFVDERLQRTDIRADGVDSVPRPGAPLTLDIGVSALSGTRCEALAGAIVDIWHCDAAGMYSDASDSNFNTKGSRFLRGYQVTNANGRVAFTTIYPGAYPGRAVHVHLKIRTSAAARALDFTSQLYFDDSLTDRVHASPVYSASSKRRTRNAGDGLYRQAGRQLQLDVVASADGSYRAAYDIGVRLG
jgi:protocatechuate 3,4-dioxygenase beta subunit